MIDETPSAVETLDVGPNGANVTGERFGHLVALHLLRKSRKGNHWLFACDCGGFCKRPIAKVRWAVNTGHPPRCSACALGSTQRRIAIGKRIRYTELFARTGRLWSLMSEERLMRDVAAALDEEGWRSPEETLSTPVMAYSLRDAIAMADAVARRPGQLALAERRAQEKSARDAERAINQQRLREEQEAQREAYRVQYAELQRKREIERAEREAAQARERAIQLAQWKEERRLALEQSLAERALRERPINPENVGSLQIGDHIIYEDTYGRFEALVKSTLQQHVSGCYGYACWFWADRKLAFANAQYIVGKVLPEAP
jgi:hypothetical protein